MTRTQNNSGAKFWNNENITKKSEQISNMRKELEGIEKGMKAKTHIDSLRAKLKKVPDWKMPNIHGF